MNIYGYPEDVKPRAKHLFDKQLICKSVIVGKTIIPAVFIIPSFALVYAVCTVLMMRSIREPD